METKHLALKAVLISFLLHIAILNFFIFTFPVKQPEDKPNFIFLGSILKQGNLSNKSFYQNKDQNIFNSNQFTDKEYDFKDTPFAITDKQKPQAKKIIDKEQKTIEKSYFKIDYNKKSQQKKGEEPIDSKYKETPYVPIKWKTSKDIFE